MQIYQNPLKIVILINGAVFFSGCEQPQPTVYEIPKEERSSNVAVQPVQDTSPVTNPAKMQPLPGMQEAANSSPEVSYETPEGWEKLNPSGIRKGNLKINTDDGVAEVTILTFPGDVGGNLANINRWRGQIGLEAATLEDIDEFSEPYAIAKHEGLYVRLEGETQSILGAILPFHGNTWFFKMLGDTSVVLANETAMRQFLSSVQFKEHVH